MSAHEGAAGVWKTFSLAEQIGNIGSELARAARYQREGNRERLVSSLDRANALLSLSLDDPRWKGRMRELAIFQEFVSDWYEDGSHYGVSLENLVAYCMPFALQARAGR